MNTPKRKNSGRAKAASGKSVSQLKPVSIGTAATLKAAGKPEPDTICTEVARPISATPARLDALTR